MRDIDFQVISATENSNRFWKTRFWKEKPVENVVTLWANGTGHTSAPLKHHFVGHRVWGAPCPNPNDIVGVLKPCLFVPDITAQNITSSARFYLSFCCTMDSCNCGSHCKFACILSTSIPQICCWESLLRTATYSNVEWYLKHSIVCKI